MMTRGEFIKFMADRGIVELKAHYPDWPIGRDEHEVENAALGFTGCPDALLDFRRSFESPYEFFFPNDLPTSNAFDVAGALGITTDSLQRMLAA